MHTVSPARARLPRRLARLVGACIAVAAVLACGPVYIPVPPPEAMFTKELLTDPGGMPQTFWITTGVANEDAASARFFIYDLESGSGVIVTARADGSYDAPPLRGEMGDRVSVYYEDLEGQRSAANCLILSEQRPIAAHCP
jgi:hypothetical protein